MPRLAEGMRRIVSAVESMTQRVEARERQAAADEAREAESRRQAAAGAAAISAMVCEILAHKRVCLDAGHTHDGACAVCLVEDPYATLAATTQKLVDNPEGNSVAIGIIRMCGCLEARDGPELVRRLKELRPVIRCKGEQ